MDITITIPDSAVNEDKDLARYLEALQLMANRMAVSHFKYGNMADKYPHSALAHENAKVRLNSYIASGNTEDCLDAANFAVIEYLRPAHARSHFRSRDSRETKLTYRED